MRVSLSVTNYSWTGPIQAALAGVAQAADEGGLDTLWVPDHLFQADPTSTREAEMLEAYTTMGFLAAQTSRIRLGTAVTAVTYRPPALLVKAVTTLDVLSQGRAWLGIGSGYADEEAASMGLPLPPVAARFECLEETLQIAAQMWAGDDAPFHGEQYQLGWPINSPRSITRPHPPILIGGMGERKTLRLVARYGDACNLFDIPGGASVIEHKLTVLARHCEAEGRPYDDIDKTIGTRLEPGESPQHFAARCAALGELGIGHVVVITSGPWTEDGLATLAATAAAVKDF